MDKRKPKKLKVKSTNSRGRRFSQLVTSILHKQKQHGLIEIDESHPKYELAVCMQEGLSWCPEATLDVEKNDLSNEDFAEVVEAKLLNKHMKKGFLFKSYAPKVFLCLRRNLGISEDFYQESLGLDEDLPLNRQNLFLQFLSNSKNKQDFFLSNNNCYMIKTEKNLKDALFFLKILPQYFDHLEKYPHSLLVRYLGLHYIQLRGQKGRFFTVMQSVFHPEERIHCRYDLKGCKAKRWQSPKPDNSETVPVLKDINFQNEVIQLGPLKKWFHHQLCIDGNFMENINVMDYSLLVGYHELQKSEIENNNMADVVLRVSKSFKFHQSNQFSKPNGQPSNVTQLTTITQGSDSAVYSREEETLSKVSIIGDHQPTNVTTSHKNDETNNSSTHLEDESILPGVVNFESTSSLLEANSPRLPNGIVQDGRLGEHNISGSNNSVSDSPEDDNFIAEQIIQRNLRYLPNCTNAVHIIDGPSKRYYIGLIDILTEYGARKKAECLLKSILHPNISFSTVSPCRYNKRFCQFFQAHCE